LLSNQNIVALNMDGSIKYSKFYKAPKDPLIVRALYGAYGLGGEFSLGAVDLRMGYSSLGSEFSTDGTALGKVLGQLSTGLGLRLGFMKLDYALRRQSGELGFLHKAALTFSWGG